MRWATTKMNACPSGGSVKAIANSSTGTPLLKPMALETDTFTGIKTDLSSRGYDHLQIVSEDGMRGVVDFRSNIEIKISIQTSKVFETLEVLLRARSRL